MVNVRALLKLSYIENFNMKKLTNAIFQEFDKYNYEINVAQSYIDSMLGSGDIQVVSNNRGKSQPVLSIVEKRQKILDEIDAFEKKIKEVKAILSDDELLVFHYSIEERETNAQVSDRMCRSMKTFLHIKKSCFVKVALKLGLTDNLDKIILKTINQLY